MMTLTHTLSASLVALTSAGVMPEQTGYVLTAFAVPTLIDLDHVYAYIKNRKFFEKHGYAGNLHYARSPIHELFGLFVVSIICLLLYFKYSTISKIVFISFIVHLSQDFILGKSFPLNPLSKNEMHLFLPTMKQKIIVDVSLSIGSIIIWILYLKGLV